MTVNRIARTIAAPIRYAGTSNQVFTCPIQTYHGAARRRAVPIVIPNTTVIPRVSRFRIRRKKSSNAKYTSRMIGAYAQPCHVRATVVRDIPARRLYRTAVRFSRKNSPRPERTAAGLRHDSTHRFSLIDLRARRKKKYPVTTKKRINASWSASLAMDRWRWPGETARRNAATRPARRLNASFTSAYVGKTVSAPNRAVDMIREYVIASHGVANAGEMSQPDRRENHANIGGLGFTRQLG